MKKIVIFLFCFFVVFSIMGLDINADMAFIDTDAGHATIPRASYASVAHAGLANDDDYGLSYFVSKNTYDTISVVDYSNWLGTQLKEVPKYDVIVLRYPYLLDTLVADANIPLGQFSFTDFNVTQVIPGEYQTYYYQFSDSETKTESFYLETSFDYINETNLGVMIPYYGIEFGLGMSSTLEAHVLTKYQSTVSRTISFSYSGNVIIDNRVTSPYYQNGKIIYANFGERALYYLQVVAVCAIQYDLDYTYYTGTWPFRTKHYVYDDTYSDYDYLYQSYEFHSAYNRGTSPFIYIWDATNNSYQLVSQMRELNRVYIR